MRTLSLTPSSLKEILTIRYLTPSNTLRINIREGKEVCLTMLLVIKVFGHAESDAVLHLRIMLHASEVVIPRILIRDHEKAEETVREDERKLLIKRWQVSLMRGVLLCLAILSSPFEARRSQFESGEGA